MSEVKKLATREGYAQGLLALGEKYDNMAVLDADLAAATKTDVFKKAYPERIAAIKSDKYYINMMLAWYFATALAKQWEAVIPFIENGLLSDWVHNKTIQKAIESYRITPEQKKYLRALRRK